LQAACQPDQAAKARQHKLHRNQAFGIFVTVLPSVRAPFVLKETARRLVKSTGADRGQVDWGGREMSQVRENTVLFLCTGNYYRSRFAEVFFNAVATKEGLC